MLRGRGISRGIKPKIINDSLINEILNDNFNDWEKVHQKYFVPRIPGLNIELIKQEILKRTHGLKLGPFSPREDYEILQKVFTKKPAWGILSYRLHRRCADVAKRYNEDLKQKASEMVALGKGPNVGACLHQLQRQLEEGKSWSFELKGIWTPELDNKLLSLVRKMGPCFDLLINDLPGFNQQQLFSRYRHLTRSPLLPFEEKILLQLANKKVWDPETVVRALPGHSPISLKLKLKRNATGKFLNDEQIHYIAKGFEEYGSDFIYTVDMTKFPNLKYVDVKSAWVIIELIIGNSRTT
jgi:hypothetical protein